MPVVFQSRPGHVVQLDDPVVQCATRLLGFGRGDAPRFETERSIVTRMTVSEQTNVQFLHTLGSQIFIYTFGDRMGSIGLSGLSFACPCPDDGAVGAEKMLLWYRARRVSRRQDPVRVLLGRQAIEGFVVAFGGEIVDPGINLFQWNVTLATLPGDD